MPRAGKTQANKACHGRKLGGFESVSENLGAAENPQRLARIHRGD
jgi:hypothetical protein